MGMVCCVAVFSLSLVKDLGDRRRNKLLQLIGIARNFIVVFLSTLVTYIVCQHDPKALNRINHMPSGLPDFSVCSNFPFCPVALT